MDAVMIWQAILIPFFIVMLMPSLVTLLFGAAFLNLGSKKNTKNFIALLLLVTVVQIFLWAAFPYLLHYFII